MKKSSFQKLRQVEHAPLLLHLIKWLAFALPIGVLVGSASALFLLSLNTVTDFRESHVWIILFLPLGGWFIGWTYFRFGEHVVKGNNLILEEYHEPKQVIPFRMAPMVLLGTLITHLFGGSAGREGTAVQMGVAISDQFTSWFRLSTRDRKMLLVMGISAGFASVFGTPLAGAVFALEVLMIGKMRYEALIPSVLVAIIANEVCHAWGVPHTVYTIPFVPEMDVTALLWTILAGLLFGLTALLFAKITHFWGSLFSRMISLPPLRPFFGGLILALVVLATGATKYIGLGIPTIVNAFSTELPHYDFLIKILFTSFTLGAGFKGGEVTPLFFVGATLGNALVWFIPLPVALLAGMGFVAVFAGATNTPIACTLMGIELFGADSAVFIALSCVVAYMFSGHHGMYGSQKIGLAKHRWFRNKEGKYIIE